MSPCLRMLNQTSDGSRPMNMTLLVVVILAISSCAYAASFVTRSNCPTPNNCDTDYNPSDCKSLEQGYFVVDEQECPGCQICIHKADRYIRLLKWIRQKRPIPEEYLPPSCFPHTYEDPEFICREDPFNGVYIASYGYLFYDVHSRCLEEVYPGTGARVNGAECPMLYAHSQYFYNSDGHKCQVYETINC